MCRFFFRCTFIRSFPPDIKNFVPHLLLQHEEWVRTTNIMMHTTSTLTMKNEVPNTVTEMALKASDRKCQF
jgi:hypothetical protein